MLYVMPITHFSIFQHSGDKPFGTLVDIEIGRIDIPKKKWAEAV
jgi:hypothetical protein